MGGSGTSESGEQPQATSALFDGEQGEAGARRTLLTDPACASVGGPTEIVASYLSSPPLLLPPRLAVCFDMSFAPNTASESILVHLSNLARSSKFGGEEEAGKPVAGGRARSVPAW